MKLKTLACVISLFATFGTAMATEDPNVEIIKKNVTKSLAPIGGIEKISKSQFADLYEIITPRGIAYTDKRGSFVMHNAVIIDSSTDTNLSEKRMDELSKFKWSDLPLKDAIKVVNGNGKRIIATIEDANCGYCKKLATELAKLPDTTIYTFVVAILGPDSTKMGRNILCSENKAGAWLALMRENKTPDESKLCETPLERNAILSTKLRVMGTPAILFPSGERLPGFATVEKIEEKLKKIN